MTSRELKEKVIESISNLEDDNILLGLLNYIEIESDENSKQTLCTR